METTSLMQGTPAWHAHRAKYKNASDAPAVMGQSKYKTRSQFMAERATGITPEHDAATESRFAKGHIAEALARPIAEEIVGEELYTTVGVQGEFSASFDGITAADNIVFEHKAINQDIRACKTAADLHPMYLIQMEQQLMVSGAEECLFLATRWMPSQEITKHYIVEYDGTLKYFTLEEEIHFWYQPDLELRAQIIAAWKQFNEDLAAYVPPAIEPAPIVVAPIENLPALTVELVGQVTSSNLAAFKAAALERIDAINIDLQTDEDFAIAKKTVKFLDDGEKRLVLVKQQALAQTSSIDELFRTMDQLREEMKAKRLTLDKLVTKREADVKVEIVNSGKDRLAAHVAALDARLGKAYMPAIPADFAAAIKGKRNLASMRDAVDTLLSQKMIEASAKADLIQTNLATLRDLAGDYKFLFADTTMIVLKANDDLTALIHVRVEAHKKAEDEHLEKERERIRAEEQAKIAAAQRIEAERAAATVTVTTVETPAPPVEIVAAQPPVAPPRVLSAVPSMRVTPVDGAVLQMDDALAYLDIFLNRWGHLKPFLRVAYEIDAVIKKEKARA